METEKRVPLTKRTEEEIHNKAEELYSRLLDEHPVSETLDTWCGDILGMEESLDILVYLAPEVVAWLKGEESPLDDLSQLLK